MKRTPFKRKPQSGELRGGGDGSKLETAVKEIYQRSQDAGEISELRFQPLVYFSCGMRWRPDAVYFCHARNTRVWVEAKGLSGKNYLICKKLWEDGYGPGPLEIWKGSFQRPLLVQTIIPRALPK